MRTVAEIEAAIIAEKDTKPALVGLSNTSPTAIWRLWVYIIAFAHWLHEQFFAAHVSEVEAIASRAIPGTSKWYHYQILQYQDGYTLAWNATTLKYEYSAIDESAKLINLAAVKENAAGGLIVKVAKKTGTNPEPLAAPELSAFTSYLNQIKFAGTFISVISENADDIKIYADIYYNGTQLQNNVKLKVESAINSYLFKLPFDGIFQLSKLQDAIQSVPEIVDCALTLVQAKFGSSAYQIVILDYYPYSGYLQVASATPLTSTINYIAR